MGQLPGSGAPTRLARVLVNTHFQWTVARLRYVRSVLSHASAANKFAVRTDSHSHLHGFGAAFLRTRARPISQDACAATACNSFSNASRSKVDKCSRKCFESLSFML